MATSLAPVFLKTATQLIAQFGIKATIVNLDGSTIKGMVAIKSDMDNAIKKSENKPVGSGDDPSIVVSGDNTFVMAATSKVLPQVGATLTAQSIDYIVMTVSTHSCNGIPITFEIMAS